MQNINEIDDLIKLISKLPGLGPKSAKRIVLKLINNKDEIVKILIDGSIKAQEIANEVLIDLKRLLVLTLKIEKSTSNIYILNMFIQTEETPNPNTLKFIPGVNVLEVGTVEFKDKDSAKISNLANLIFQINGIDRVFLATDFLSVTKNNDNSWEILKPLILTAIMDHFASGKAVIEKTQDDTNELTNEDTEVVKQIKELIDQRVRPAVAMDGGDISFCSFEDGVVTLQMKGACAGCPSSTATLKMGIENMLRHYIPEVLEVKAAEL